MYTTRLSFLFPCDYEVICTYGEATFLIVKTPFFPSNPLQIAFIQVLCYNIFMLIRLKEDTICLKVKVFGI